MNESLVNHKSHTLNTHQLSMIAQAINAKACLVIRKAHTIPSKAASVREKRIAVSRLEIVN